VRIGNLNWVCCMYSLRRWLLYRSQESQNAPIKQSFYFKYISCHWGITIRRSNSSLPQLKSVIFCGTFQFYYKLDLYIFCRRLCPLQALCVCLGKNGLRNSDTQKKKKLEMGFHYCSPRIETWVSNTFSHRDYMSYLITFPVNISV
jgi:hypothetical protein